MTAIETVRALVNALEADAIPTGEWNRALADGRALIAQMQSEAAAQPVNEWKEAALDEMAHQCWDCSVDTPPRDIVSKVISIAVQMALDPEISAGGTQPAQAGDICEQHLRIVLNAVTDYLPPDGIGMDAAMSRIIGAVDPWPVASPSAAVERPVTAREDAVLRNAAKRGKIVAAGAPAAVEPIPSGVYWNPLADNFYSIGAGQGQGNEFYMKWRARHEEFPCQTLSGTFSAPAPQPVEAPLPAQQQGWQPIETAPPECRWLLLAAEFDGPGDWRIKMGYRSTDLDSFHGWKIVGASWAPTRWMPLPPPPEAAPVAQPIKATP